jgi:tape measure domain-containing protein
MPVSNSELRILLNLQAKGQEAAAGVAQTIQRVKQTIDEVGRSQGFRQAAQQAEQLGQSMANAASRGRVVVQAYQQIGQAAAAAARQAQAAANAMNASQRAGGGSGGFNAGGNQQAAASLSNIQAAFKNAQQSASSAGQSITQALMSIGNAARGVAGGVAGGLSAAFNGLRTAAGGLTSVVGSVTGLSGAARGLGTASNDVNSFGASIRNMVALGASIAGFNTLLTTLQGVFRTFSDAAIGFNSQLENARIAFTGLFQDGNKARAFILQLQDFAAKTAFDFPGLLHLSQMLVGVGLDAENVIPLLRNVAGAMTAAGRTAADVQGVGLALQQVFTAGKVNAQDMNQLIQRGIPAWTIMAEAIKGVDEPIEAAVTRVRKLGEQGKITSKDFFAAFQEYARNHNLAEIAENAVASFSGAMSNLGDGFRNLVASAAEPAFNRISAGIQGIANMLTSAPAKQFGLDMQATLEQVIRSLEAAGQKFSFFFQLSKFGGASDIQAAFSGIVSMFEAFGADMQSAGAQLMVSYAQGIIQGAQDAIQGAVDFVADLIASYLIGNSPPPSGPLANIDQGGRNVAVAWLGGLSEGFQGIEQILVPVTTALGDVGKGASLENIQGVFRSAAGDAKALAAAGEEAEGALRTLGQAQRDLDTQQGDLKNQVDTIKDGYDAQASALERQIDAVKDQNTYAERYADLIQKQNDAISRQADLRDRAALNELKAAEIAAEGDPVRRAQLVAEQEALKSREKDLQLAQREHDLAQRQTQLNERSAKAKKDGKAGTSGTDATDIALAQQRIDLDRAQLKNERDLAGLVDKGRLAEIAAAKATIERNRALRQVQEDRARAATDEVKNAAEIERAQKDILALPLEEQLAAIKREQEDQLRPLEARLGVLQREERQLQAIRAQWQGIKQDIAEATKDQKAADKSSKGGGASALFPNGRPALDREEVDMSVLDRVGHSMAQGVGEAFQRNLGPVIFGAIGAVLGGNLFGPLGFAAGAAFGAQVGAGVQSRVPDLTTIFQDAGRTFLQAFAGEWSTEHGDDWVSPLVDAAGRLGIAMRATADIVGKAWTALKTPVGAAMQFMRDNTGLVAAALSGPLVSALLGVGATALRVFSPLLTLFARLSPLMVVVSASAVALKVAWDRNIGGLQDTVEAAAGPIQKAFGDLDAALDSLQRGDYSGFADAIRQMGSDVIAAVAPIAQGLIDAFLAWIPGALAGLQEGASQVVQFLMTQGPAILTALATWGVQFVNWIAPVVGQMVGALGTILAGLLLFIAQNAGPILDQLGTWATAFIDWIAPIIGNLIVALGAVVAAIIAHIIEKAPEILAQLALWGQQFLDWIAPAIPPMMVALQALGQGILDWIGQELPLIAEQLALWGAEFTTWVVDASPGMLEALGTMAESFYTWFSEVFAKITENTAKWATEMLIWIVRDVVPRLPEFYQKFIDGIAALMLAMVKTLGDWGLKMSEAFITGIIEGLRQQFPGLAKALEDIMGPAFNLVHRVTGRSDVADVGTNGVIDPKKIAQMPLSIDPRSGRDAVLQQWAPVLKAIEQSGGPLARNIAAIILAENGGGNSDLVRNSKNWFSISASAERRAMGLQSGVDQGGRFASYDSDAQALADFIDLISTLPRYTDAWAARLQSTEQFISGLIPHGNNKGGYIVPEPGYPVEDWVRNTSSGARTFDEVAGSIPAPEMMQPIARSGNRMAANGVNARGVSDFKKTQAQWSQNAADAGEICGPYLAALFADAVGRPATPEEARAIAESVGIYSRGPNGQGSGILSAGGYGSYVNSVIKATNPGTGVRAEQTTVGMPAQAGLIAAQSLQSGSPLVGFNTPRHYFGATEYDPSTQKFNTGGTGMVYGNTNPWLSVTEMAELGKGMTGVITLVGQMGEGFTQMKEQADAATASVSTGVETDAAAVQTLSPEVQAAAEAQAVYAQTLSGQVVPAGAATGNAIQQMTAAITPLMAQVASGTMTTDELVNQLALLAANTQLTSEPLLGLANGTLTAQQAMGQLFDAASAIDPQFATLSTQMQSTNADAQTMAVTFAEGVGNSTGVATEAIAQMAASIDPLVQQVAAGQQEGGALEQTLVQLAASTGLATDPFRDLQNGVTDSNSALREVINQTRKVSPQFEELAQGVDESGTVSREAALQYLQLVAAFKKGAPATDDAAQGAEEVAQSATEAVTPVVELADTVTTQASASAEAFATTLPQGVQSGIDAVRALTGDASAAGNEVGTAIVSGMQEGISGAAESVAERAADVVRQAIAAAREAADAHSPSNETRELGWNMNAGLEIGQIEDSKYVEDAARGVVALALDAMRDEADAHSPSQKGVQIGKDILQGLIKGLQSGNLGDIARQQVGEYIKIASGFSDEWAGKIGADVARIQHQIAGSMGGYVETTMAVKDAQEAIEKASAGTWEQQQQIAALGVQQAEVQKRMASTAVADLAVEQQLRDAQQAQERARAGSLASQQEQAALGVQMAQLALQEATNAERSLEARQQLAAVQAQQEQAAKGSLADQIRQAQIAERTAAISLQQAQAERDMLPIRNQVRDIQKQIEETTKSTVEAQQQAIRTEAANAAKRIEQLQIQDKLALGEDTGGGMSQEEINALHQRDRALQQQADSASRAAEIEKLQATIATASDRERLVALQDQLSTREDALQPVADEKAALDAENAVIAANNALQAAGYGEQVVLLQTQVDQYDAISTSLQDQQAVLEARQAVLQATNELEAAGYEASIVALQAMNDQIEARKQADQDILDNIQAQQSVIETTTALEAARLQSNLIHQQELLDAQSAGTRQLQRQLEILQAQADIISTQVQYANALKKALEDAGILGDDDDGGGKKKKKKKKKAIGGPLLRGDVALVGEYGAEIWTAPSDGYILNHSTTQRLMDSLGVMAPRMASIVRQRQVGGSVWAGRDYLVGEGSGVEGFASAPVRAPSYAGQPVKVVNSTVHYHVHEQQRSGEARVERVVYEAVQIAMNS